MTGRENVIRAARFESPEYIPMRFSINPSCWNYYDNEALLELILSHPLLFPGFKDRKPPAPYFSPHARKEEPYTDPWGCVWKTSQNGISGSVMVHPLERPAEYDKICIPDPEHTNGLLPVSWKQHREKIDGFRAEGRIIEGALPHGHTFLRLNNLLGFERLTLAMSDRDGDLERLIEIITDFNLRVVLKWLELSPDLIKYPEDLGMQSGPMISPEHFRRYIKPSYMRLIKPAADDGVIIHMHSDGDIKALIDDLLGCGIHVINLQDRVNGIEWIAGSIAGKVCIEIDVDRQDVTPRGSPRQIDELIQKEVRLLGSRRGGLMMVYGLFPGPPLKNVKAVMDAMEKYATFYS